jgi:adenosylhomocysteine nucleosidase
MSEHSTPANAVIVTFALPDESRPFVQSLAECQASHAGKPPALPSWTGMYREGRVTVVHTGVGDTAPGRERLRAAIVAAGAGLRAVISAGYAGALVRGMQVGDLVLGENFSDPRLTEKVRLGLRDATLYVGSLASRNVVAETAIDKARLAAETGALAVDMETGWIAEICTGARVPLLSLRVISDAADQDFPVPGSVLFSAVRQRPRYVALPLWLLVHPWRIAPFAAFVRGLGPARERLTRALQTVVAEG